MFVLGTRPEAVKLAPVIHAARHHPDWELRVCSTGQHRELLAPFLATFALTPDVELATMSPGQSVGRLLATVVGAVDDVLAAERPDMIVVQGDTTTVAGAALAATMRAIPVAHVEAGLRTFDRRAPFPEEQNRVIVGQLAALHLAPSPRAVANLRREGVGEADIVCTGNTVVDAVRWIRAGLPAGAAAPEALARVLPKLRPAAPMVLVTGHRRESFDGGLLEVCAALAEISTDHPEIDIVYPVHLNPAVGAAVTQVLAGRDNVHLCPPVDYPSSIWLIGRSRFVVTDSGGIQEEAPELGKPALVTRAATERPEAVEIGAARIVGYDRAALRAAAEQWLRDPQAYALAVPTRNPFGDGRAALRCVAALRERLALPFAPIEAWSG